MSLKIKAKTSTTITITIALILFSCNVWEDYKVLYKDSIRSIEIENVERLQKCRTPKNGYKTYQCPECGKKKYVLSPVNADYVHLVVQRQQTNGPIGYIISF
ncbi:MAG: transposase zinc-binding domain-containing protein [Candidatus Methanoperedens sp.]|nr:transposase zinc-binding domain-containing protein [Candidatus Methanoperedens sp.]